MVRGGPRPLAKPQITLASSSALERRRLDDALSDALSDDALSSSLTRTGESPPLGMTSIAKRQSLWKSLPVEGPDDWWTSTSTRHHAHEHAGQLTMQLLPEAGTSALRVVSTSSNPAAKPGLSGMALTSRSWTSWLRIVTR